MRLLTAILMFVSLATTAFAFDARSGNSVDISKPIADDVAASGQNVAVTSAVTGNAMLAGTNVEVKAPVEGLLAAAGSNVTVTGKQQSVFVAGSSVIINEAVARNMVIAGSSVNIDEPTKIAIDAIVAGSNVTSRATIGRDLRVTGTNITIGGKIAGDVKVYGNRITILPGTVIRGDFIYTSPAKANIDPSARILGKTVRQEAEREEPTGWSGRIMWGILTFLMMLAFGALFSAIFPAWTSSAADNIPAKPGWSALSGIIVLIVAPAASIIAMITVIGLPIGLAILLAYLFTWILATPIAAIALGSLILRRGNMFLRLLVGLLVIYIVYLVPFIGGMLKLAVVLFGFGAIWMNIFGRRDSAAVIARQEIA